MQCFAIRGVHDHIPVVGTVAAAIAVAAGMPFAVLEIQCITCIRIFVGLPPFDRCCIRPTRQTITAKAAAITHLNPRVRHHAHAYRTLMRSR